MAIDPPAIPADLGWFVSEADGSILNDDGRRPFQVQKDDEMERFETDEAAWSAMLASPYRDAVMSFLKVESPAEYEEISASEAPL